LRAASDETAPGRHVKRLRAKLNQPSRHFNPTYLKLTGLRPEKRPRHTRPAGARQMISSVMQKGLTLA